jgi:hypothetical protein
MTSEGNAPPQAYLVTSKADVVYELEDSETQVGRSDANDIVSNICVILCIPSYERIATCLLVLERIAFIKRKKEQKIKL